MTVPDQGDATASGRSSRRWWRWGLAACLVLGAVLGVIFVPTPYVLLQPGSVRPAEPRVEVEGAETFETDGDILFTTVIVNDATLAELVRGNFDDAIDVRTRDEVYGTRGRDETREVNRQQMDMSKLVATMEALEYLGYSPTLTAHGAHVVEVSEGSGADGVIRPGDVIVAVDGDPVLLPSDLQAALGDDSPGDVVDVTVERPSTSAGESAAGEVVTETVTEQVTLGAASAQDPSPADDAPSTDAPTTDAPTGEAPTTDDGDADADRAVLGVVVEPSDPQVDSAVDVDIESGTVTGPSAGLAWSLAIVDLLTPDSLTDGQNVAVTGEILPDGSVGVIGAISQKMATVIRNGVDVFLYPADTPEAEQDEMRELAGDDVELVAVATLADAVEALSPGGVSMPD